jgi:23S rRNA (cytidine2498-2'-O)-methyltransferase
VASTFLWFLHQPASARWVKRELAARRPDLRFAFSRPGLTTFKVEASRVDEPVACSFARAWGRSLGRATDVAGVLAEAASLEGPLRLHVFERDPDRPADERAPEAGQRASSLDAALRAAAPGRFLDGTEAKPGELVLDVITAAAEHADDGIFLGWHRADASHGPFPGGVLHAAIPERAPSRAWAKIEEAIRWSGLVPRPGEHVVELGASPGGISWALLERGLDVHGIDPGLVAKHVLDYRGPQGNRFVYLRKPAAEVEKRELPRPMHWLVSDMNLAPMVALKYVERYVALAHGELRGAFLTMKVHDEGIFEALPQLMKRIDSLGARRVRYTQLPSHRSELVAILEW